MKPLRYEIRLLEQSFKPERNEPSSNGAPVIRAERHSQTQSGSQAKPKSSDYRTTNGVSLRAMRRRSYMTQAQVAECLGVSQKRVSEIEHSEITTLQISTLCRYVNAIGGDLHIVISVDR